MRPHVCTLPDHVLADMTALVGSNIQNVRVLLS